MFVSIFIFIFILGAVCGSFLNSVIYRLERQQQGERITVFKGRSFCPKCGHTLGFFDLFPILSFIFLHGKCRYCGEPISVQYPIVEIASGLLFLLIFNFQFPISNEFSNFQLFNFQTLVSLGLWWLIACFLILIFVYDLKHYVIPDKIIYPAIATAFLYQVFVHLPIILSPVPFFKKVLLNEGSLSNTTRFLAEPVLRTALQPEVLGMTVASALAAAGFFFLLWTVSRGKWLGFGDVKLAFLMGIFLGWPSILVALFLSFLSGAIIGLGLIIFGKKNLKSQIPFGPFLTANTFIALFWGKQIINWYLSVFS